MSPLLPVFKALADATRLRILRTLQVSHFNVGELCTILQLGQSRVSRHLKILSDAGLLRSRREGSWVYYGLPQRDSDQDPALSRLLEVLADSPEDEEAVQDRARALETLELRSRRSRQYFEEVASHWDQEKRRFLGEMPYLGAVEAAVPECEVLADLGSGTGDLLLQRAPRHARLIGVDHSTRMIAEAERRRDAAGADHIEFRLGALEHLPLRDGEADAAVVNMVLHHVADPPAVLREIHRAIGPGGTLVIADLAAHSEEWMREELNHQWLGFEAEDLASWLESAGFDSVTTRTCPTGEGAPPVLLATGRRMKTIEGATPLEPLAIARG